MSEKSTLHLGDCLCGVLGLKIVQFFSVESRHPWPIWWMIVVAFFVLILWMRED